jgi:hypothetical protein
VRDGRLLVAERRDLAALDGTVEDRAQRTDRTGFERRLQPLA